MSVISPRKERLCCGDGGIRKLRPCYHKLQSFHYWTRRGPPGWLNAKHWRLPGPAPFLAEKCNLKTRQHAAFCEYVFAMCSACSGTTSDWLPPVLRLHCTVLEGTLQVSAIEGTCRSVVDLSHFQVFLFSPVHPPRRLAGFSS